MRWSVLAVLLALALVSCITAVTSQDGDDDADHVPEEPAREDATEDEEEGGDEESGSEDEGDLREGHTSKKKQKTKHKPVFVPVPLQKKKKKDKIISITQGMYIPGGQPLYGKFKSIKACAKACSKIPNCFSVDYDKWTHKCFVHGNTTSCGKRQPHPSITHLAKIPCTSNDLPTGSGSRVVIGAAMSFGIEMKGIDDLKSCMKKCLTLGGGVASAPSLIQTQAQLCVAINFDFASYKCYVFPQIPDGIMNICRIAPAVLGADAAGVYTPRRSSRLLYPSSNVVTIFLCPPNTLGASTTQ